jgi:hypothetical protein
MGLSNCVQNRETQIKIAEECAQLMDEQVATKKGISGLAIKTAYRALKGLGPGYISRALQGLLPQALRAVEPMWEEGAQAGDPVTHLSQNREQTAEILLGVTDTKISNAQNKIVIAAYKQVRKFVKGDIEEAVPGLAKIIGNYANT